MAPKRASVQASGGLLPPNKVKRIMLEDEDVGRISEPSCILAARAAELLVRDLLAASASDAAARGSRSIDIGDVQSAVARTELFDFLRETVDAVAERVETKSAAPKARKKGGVAPEG